MNRGYLRRGRNKILANMGFKALKTSFYPDVKSFINQSPAITNKTTINPLSSGLASTARSR